MLHSLLLDQGLFFLNSDKILTSDILYTKDGNSMFLVDILIYNLILTCIKICL